MIKIACLHVLYISQTTSFEAENVLMCCELSLICDIKPKIEKKPIKNMECHKSPQKKKLDCNPTPPC